MGKRGPEPVNPGSLSLWEFEFYKAFHLLRDGLLLPQKYAAPLGLNSEEIEGHLSQLQAMSPERYWLTSRRLTAEFGERLNLQRPPSQLDLTWADYERNEEIRRLERELRPPSIKARARRRKIWNDLVRAGTYATLRKACGRWARLPDVRRARMTPFPRYILENAAQFLSMKENKRFPRSVYGDEARLEYLARGMAGVHCGVSAMTGIERLRNMKHDRNGALWTTRTGDFVLPERERYCRCWRCSILKRRALSEKTREQCEGGLKVFLEVAATVKVPKEWRMRKRF